MKVIKFKIKFCTEWQDAEKMEVCLEFLSIVLNGHLVIKNCINSQLIKYSLGTLMKFFCCTEMVFKMMQKAT